MCGYFAVFLAARCLSSDWLEAKGRILDDARKADNQTCYECQPEAEETLWLRVFLSFSLFHSSLCPSNICVLVYAREKQIRRGLTMVDLHAPWKEIGKISKLNSYGVCTSFNSRNFHGNNLNGDSIVYYYSLYNRTCFNKFPNSWVKNGTLYSVWWTFLDESFVSYFWMQACIVSHVVYKFAIREITRKGRERNTSCCRCFSREYARTYIFILESVLYFLLFYHRTAL